MNKNKILCQYTKKRDPWAESTSSYSSQRSNEFATSFEDFNNNNNTQSTWYYYN